MHLSIAFRDPLKITKFDGQQSIFSSKCSLIYQQQGTVGTTFMMMCIYYCLQLKKVLHRHRIEEAAVELGVKVCGGAQLRSV